MRCRAWFSALVSWSVVCCSVPSAMAAVSWYKSFNGQNPTIQFSDIATTNDGGIIATGNTAASPSKPIAYKFDSFGSIQWQKDLNLGLSVLKAMQASDGGYVFLAQNWYYSNITYLIKVSADGSGEWYKAVKGLFRIIIQSDDGGFLLYNGPKLIKVDRQGNFIQETQYKKADGTYFLDSGWNVAVKTPEGDLLAGYMVSNQDANITGKAIICKLRQDGSIIWQKELDYSSVSSHLGYFHAINCTPDGGFVIGMSFWGSRYNALLKFNSTGQPQFQKKIKVGANPDSLLRDILVTPDNGYLIGFQTMYIPNIDSYEAPVYKFNDSGELQWSIHGKSRWLWKKMADDTLITIEGTPAYSSSMPNILSKTSSLFDLSGCDPVYVSNPPSEIADIYFPMRDALFSANMYNLPPGSKVIWSETSDYMLSAPANSCFRKPIISLSSAGIDFGATKLNHTVTKDLVITNSGDASLDIRQIHQPDSPNFTVSGACSLLAPKASCTLSLTFTPTALGTVSGMLAIDSDDPYKPTEFVALSGSSSDSIPPLTSYYFSGTSGLNGWFTSDVAVSLEATDADSGVDSITYSINGVQVKYPGSAVKFNVIEEKENAIAFYAVDNAGNQESATTIPLEIDKTAPTITASASTMPNAAGWYNMNATVSFACSDATSGIAECPSTVTLSQDGAGQIVSGNAVDGAGLTATTSVTVNLDTTPPTITINGVQNGAKYPLGLVPTASYAVSDSLSGVASSSDALTGGDGLGLGTFTYKVAASDVADNTTTVSVNYEVIATPEGLIALIRQMYASGKIDNAGIANSLIAKVENAQKANGNAADNIMQAFINQVEAQSGGHIASDAAAILIHAAEYIISH